MAHSNEDIYQPEPDSVDDDQRLGYDDHIISQASNAWLKNPITEFRKFTSLLLVLLTLSMASNFNLSKGKHHQQTYNKTLSPYLERQAAYGRF